MAYDRSDTYTNIKQSVASIGEWIEEKCEPIAYWLGMGIFGLSALSALIAVVVTWVQNGFFKALLTAVGSLIALGIFFYIVSIAAGIGGYVIRFISLAFKNLYVLEIVILIVLSVIYFSSDQWKEDSQITRWGTDMEYVQSEVQAKKYKCTASKILNVREAPSSDAKVIGAIRSGDVVEVYDISDGYARIIYNGQDAYANISYLEAI